METDHVSEPQSYLSFQVGDELYAANVESVLNILEMTTITRVPKAPNYLKGVINLRGTVLPVIDTRTKFGLEETAYGTNTCILVLELLFDKETIRLGAIVDSVKEVIEIKESDIQPPPSLGSSFKTSFIKGMTKPKDEFIMILNINEVFGSDETIKVQGIDTEEILA